MNTPNISCPTCKKQITWSSAYPERPFCSKRCQQIDLGAWASEAFVIEGAASASPEDASVFEQTTDPTRRI